MPEQWALARRRFRAEPLPVVGLIRPGAVWNLPARHEGDHCQLGLLVREEAARHTALLPEEETQGRRADVVRHIENRLWDWLRFGWCRPRGDWSELLFWQPYLCAFVAWSPELAAAYGVLSGDLGHLRRSLSGAYIGGGAGLPEMRESTYVGGVSRLAPGDGAYIGKRG